MAMGLAEGGMSLNDMYNLSAGKAFSEGIKNRQDLAAALYSEAQTDKTQQMLPYEIRAKEADIQKQLNENIWTGNPAYQQGKVQSAQGEGMKALTEGQIARDTQQSNVMLHLAQNTARHTATMLTQMAQQIQSGVPVMNVAQAMVDQIPDNDPQKGVKAQSILSTAAQHQHDPKGAAELLLQQADSLGKYDAYSDPKLWTELQKARLQLQGHMYQSDKNLNPTQAIHNSLVARGIKPDSKEYITELENSLRNITPGSMGQTKKLKIPDGKGGFIEVFTTDTDKNPPEVPTPGALPPGVTMKKP